MTGATKDMSVLWVEDEPSTIDGPLARLEFAGVDVVLAETAAEARRSLAGRTFDFVIVDQWLRPRDGDRRELGVDLVDALRAGHLGTANAGVPFMFVTGHRDWVDGDAAAALGGYLGTVHKVDDVSAALEDALGRLLVVPGLVGPDGQPLQSGTPEHERLLVTFGAISDQVLAALAARPALMHDMHWRDFEELVAEMWQRNGWDVELTPPRGDDGVDVYAARSTADGRRLLYVIDCKRYTPRYRIGPDLVRHMRGVVARDGADCGVMMTTTSFTDGARRESHRGPLRLSLRDLEAITRHLRGEPLD